MEQCISECQVRSSRRVMRLMEWLRMAIENWRARRQLRILDDLSDDALRDIGISRSDIHWAARLPMTQAPFAELSRLARRRSR